MKLRHLLRRMHVWLGWVVGIPILLWIATGLVMVAKPIETVRGEALIAEVPPLAPAGGLVPPPIGPRPIRSILLQQQGQSPVWIVRFADGAARLADPLTGRWLPPLGAVRAAELVRDRYTGGASIRSVDRISGEDPPLEWRRKVDAWRVGLSDGTNIYVDAATGEIAARRTPFWRFYDLMWGLHIMDLKGREDSHNPLVIAAAALALIATLLALVLLPMTLGRSTHRPGPPDQ
ncbi:MAG TPA: hypothetical protein VF628_08950 [Allosphingosinicella sp.]|jgi:hypothetical protein